MNLEQIVNAFVDESIELDEYIKQVNTLTLKEVSDIYKINQTDHMDQRMHAILIIWLLKHSFIHLTKDIDNPYLSYLDELIDDGEVKSSRFLTITKEYIMAHIVTNKDNIYMIINHSNEELSVKLPKEIANQVVYCFNCNDDLPLGSRLSIPEYSFYALKTNQ